MKLGKRVTGLTPAAIFDLAGCNVMITNHTAQIIKRVSHLVSFGLMREAGKVVISVEKVAVIVLLLLL